MTFLGFDVNGARDLIARSSGSATKADRIHLSEVLGAIARPPLERRERWIAGEEARATLVPGHMPHPYEETVFLLDAIEATLADEPSFVNGTDEAKHLFMHEPNASAAIAAHLSTMAREPAVRNVIAVPDTLREEAQDRMLGIARSALPGISELLWRPVAVVLGWTEGMTHGERRALDGKTVAHVHVGASSIDVSFLELRVQTHEHRAFVVPIRNGRGWRIPIPGAFKNAVESAMERDLLTLPICPSAKEVLVLEQRPWRAALGMKQLEVVLPSKSAGYMIVDTPSSPEPQDHAEALDRFEEAMRAGRLSANAPVIIEGTSSTLPTGTTTLGEALASIVRRSRKSVVDVSASVAAVGAARYAWRRAFDLPTYEDVLPRLSILVQTKGAYEWVDLVPAGERVRGGSQFGPRPVPGFSVGQNTEEIKYAITREDDPWVRMTTTSLPFPTKSQFPVELIVTQHPGQGAASVEIKPKERHGEFSGRTFLNWASMESTGLDPDDYMERQRKAMPLSYPDISPFPSSLVAWDQHDVAWKIRKFLDASKADADLPTLADALASALSAKVNPDWVGDGPMGRATHGVFDSDGLPPQGLRNHWSGSSEAIAKLPTGIEEVLAIAASGKHRPAASSNALYRRTLLAGSWMYAGAPKAVMEFARDVFKGRRTFTPSETASKRWAINVAGRCFRRRTDIKLVVAASLKRYEEGSDIPNTFMKAIQEIFRFREDAYLALTSQQAKLLARAAVHIMDGEVEKENLEKRFFNAATMIIGILRYRKADPGFLHPDEPGEGEEGADQVTVTNVRPKKPNSGAAQRRVTTRPKRDSVLHDALAVLNRAKSVSARKSKHLTPLITEIEAYLEQRGSDALLYVKLMDISDGGSP